MKCEDMDVIGLSCFHVKGREYKTLKKVFIAYQGVSVSAV